MSNSDNAVNPADSGKPTSTRVPAHARRRKWWRRIATALGVVAAALVITCGALLWSTRDLGSYVLQKGTADGIPWELRASVEWGMLCMHVTDGNGQDFTGGETGNGWSCGFDNTPTDTSGEFAVSECPLYFSGGSPDSSCVWYSPAPADAVSVRIGENKTVPTHKISHFGFPHVTYWYYLENATGWPQEYGKQCELWPDNSPAPAHGCKVEALKNY